MKIKGLRQSKNIIDLRDSSSKAYKKADAISKQESKIFQGSPATESKSLKNVGTTENTKNLNRFVNIKRLVSGPSVGQLLKNRNLDSKPSTFEKKKK